MAVPEFLPILNNKPWIGRHENENDALVFLRNQRWDTNLDGTGQPREGMEFYDLTVKKKKYWNGTQWVVLEAGAVVVPSHNSLLGLNVGDYQHLTAANKATLTGGGNADALHTHAGIATGLQLGTVPVPLATSTVVIPLPVPYTSTNYKVFVDVENLIDPAPPLLLHLIVAKTLINFTVGLSASTLTANYELHWMTQGI